MERVTRGEPVAVGCGQFGEVGVRAMGPSLPRPGQGRLEAVLVAQPAQAAVLADEVELHRLHDQTLDPAQLPASARHRYLASSRSALR